MDELRVLSVCGNLGYGFPKASLDNGLARDPHIMGADNGSTDAGPYYLGSGDQLTKREQIRRDLGFLAGRREKEEDSLHHRLRRYGGRKSPRGQRARHDE